MFTGLIEEIGIVNNVRNIGGGSRISVGCKYICDDLKIDDSVSINGVCQTVIACGKDYFDVEAVEETLIKTTLKNFRPGKKVNLERAAKVGSRLGGHIVQGHTDVKGLVRSVEKLSTGILCWIEYPHKYSKYVVEHGSVCIDGVSLTVARTNRNMFMVSVIPHTWKVTTLSELQNGFEVNLEFDIIGKYVENMMIYNKNDFIKVNSILDKYLDQPEY